MKVLGEGEWKVKIHGKSRRRQWIKLHIASEVCNNFIPSRYSMTATLAYKKDFIVSKLADLSILNMAISILALGPQVLASAKLASNYRLARTV